MNYEKILSILMFCVYADHFGQTVVYEQNFDGLTAGTSIMNQIMTGEWATWTNTIGGNNDPFISNEQSVSGSNSVKITPNDDVIYYFGNLKNGHYKVDFEVYIANYDSLGIKSVPVSLNYNNVSVNENEFNVGVLAYPNPTTDQINLVSNQEIQFVEVYNMTGQMVKNLEVSNLETQIDLSVLKSGQYILRINFEGGQLEKNIIKQ